MSNQPPIGVPQGAIRLNTDSQKLEFYAQDRWYEMATDVPTLDGGARGTFHGGETPTRVDTMDFITISTQGNAIDFGNISTGVLRASSACSSNTRAIICSGEDGSTPRPVHLQFITFSSTGNTTDFGNLQTGRSQPAGGCNSTRGLVSGGTDSNSTKLTNIESVEIATTGNAVDFGEMGYGRNASMSASDSHGGLGGY